MKMIKLLAFCILATFASCSWFDSKPIMPKIIGNAYLLYDSTKKEYYADIDSVQYRVNCIAISNYNHFFPQMIKPIDGMKVTIFETSESELRAAVGEKTVAEIEELYRANYTPLVFIFGSVFVLATIALIKIWPRKEKGHENS